VRAEEKRFAHRIFLNAEQADLAKAREQTEPGGQANRRADRRIDQKMRRGLSSPRMIW